MESIKYALWLEKSNCNVFLFKEASHEAEKTIKKDLSESRESFSAIFVLGQAHLRQSDLKTAKMAEKI